MNRIQLPWAKDWLFVTGILLVSIWGVAMIYSAGVLNVPSPVTEGLWKRQGALLLVSLLGFVGITQIPSRWFEWIAFPAFIVWVGVLALTLVIGSGVGTAAGVKSFLSIGGFRFQPAEAAKIAAVLAMARLLSTRESSPQNLRDLLAPTALISIPLALVVLQPDLGTALAFIGILFAMLFWAGTPLPLLLFLASPGLALILSFNTLLWSAYVLAIALGLYIYRYRLYLVESAAVLLANVAAGTVAQPLWNSLAAYQRNRILVFLDPNVDPRGAGWQLIQSKVAIGSGGVFGKGFTLGTQKRLDFLPEQQTDFIFSVIGEEFGFLGTSLTILLFGVIFFRMIRMAENASDPFAGLVIFGIFGAWMTHVFISIGMTIGVVPITGIPLPFVSYGGSFLLMSWSAAAIVARVSNEDP